METNTQKIMDRVRKMMALANDAGATEAERDNALAHATAMLQKHNLKMVDLPSEDENRKELEVTISSDTWARHVCNSIASLFFCTYYFARTATSGKDRHFFVGKEGNAVAAMQMSEFLIKSIRKEASSRYGSATSKEGRSFCLGAMSAINRRVKDMLAEAQKPKQSGTGNALVLASLYQTEKLANEKFLQDKNIDIRKEKARSSRVDHAAMDAGRAHGATIQLNQQIKGA